MRNHRESGMIAIALESYEVVVLDCDTRTTVRRFKGHRAPVTDMCFSPDSRWLITASMDATIKVWDIPSAYLIDHFKLEAPCISLSMSPSGDFLATAHIDYLGVFLWSNKTLFNHITLRSIEPESEPPMLELVSFAGEADAVEDKEDEEGEIIYKEYTSPDQLEEGLLTMSDSTASRWQTLLNLDVIKRRNQPKVPIKKDKHTPFFLPTVAGLEMKFDLPAGEDGEELQSKVVVPGNFDNFTVFGNALCKVAADGDYQQPIEMLMKMGPSMVDFEIKSMGVDSVGSIKLLDHFMRLLMELLQTNRHFELVQTYLAVFLREHGPELCKDKTLRGHLEAIQSLNESGWQRLEGKLMYGLGVVGALRNFVK